MLIPAADPKAISLPDYLCKDSENVEEYKDTIQQLRGAISSVSRAPSPAVVKGRGERRSDTATHSGIAFVNNMAPHGHDHDHDESMSAMDMMGMMGGGGSSTALGGLSPAGVDFQNHTQAMDFLDEILNDDELKTMGNAYAKYFWYGVAVFIGIAAVVNLLHVTTLRLTIKAAAQKRSQPATPRNVFTRTAATLTAIARESTYLQFVPSMGFPRLGLPPMGTMMLVLAHFTFVLVLEFANHNVPGAQFWQARGVRAGWLAVAQTPLLILLVGKYNIIGCLTGVTYERINVLHRWTARIMLFLAILHFGYQSYGWQQYGLMALEWKVDSCPPTGIAALAMLLWINLSTLPYFRRLSYEFFVVQHLISFFGFIIALVYHLPTTALTSRVYVFIPIALWCLDRTVQWLFTVYRSRNITATLTALDGNATKVRLSNKTTKQWSAGSFVLLSIPRFGLVQSHPATILSTPQSHHGDMVFILKCCKGFTKRIMTGANDSTTVLLPQTKQESVDNQTSQVVKHRAFINGPYGGSQSDFAAFDSICLMAGSTGVTFTLSLLLSLADKASSGQSLPLRRIHFVWCVKDSSWAKWCSDEISSAIATLRKAGLEVDISIYVTCADGFTEQGDEPKECGCACDKSLGPCCCVMVDESDDDEIVDDDKSTTKDGKVVVTDSSASSIRNGATRLQVLPCASFFSGRPDVAALITELLDGADGESAVAVCGPVAMSSSVRNTVVRLSDERAIHKGTGAQGCYLHVEAFALG